MLCFVSFVVLLIEMELEKFKHTIIPLREKLQNIAFRLVEDQTDTEDIVQEAFLKLWYIRDKLDQYQSVEALAVTITKNTALDFLRAKKPRGEESDLLRLDSEFKTPSEQLEQKDAVECIRQLVEKLPTLQKITIRMKDIEGYELAEIAEITGTQVENVRVNLSRARKKVREQFLALNKQMV